MSPMAAFRRRYGASPLHLLLVLASFALAAYAGVRLLTGDTLGVTLWFVGAVLLHDLVLLPCYAVTDRAASACSGRTRARGRGRRGRASTTCVSRSSYRGFCCWSGGH
ncbi:hypothetical protein ABZY68_32690 [Streptomyces sp. NPDC006482]|uniref:hypothetical protein n=1 Tax=Streptomyces sp. NPDC006482 TaxID=3154306 RepID=UPI0033B669E0